MTITADKVRRNSWTDNLADDWIGTDDSGNVIVRGDEQTVRRNPDATSFFTKADLDAAAVRRDPATDPGNPTPITSCVVQDTVRVMRRRTLRVGS